MNEWTFDGFVYWIFRNWNSLNYKCYSPENEEVLSIEMNNYLYLPKSQVERIEKYNKLWYHLLWEACDSRLSKDVKYFLEINSNSIEDILYLKIPNNPYVESKKFLVLVKFKWTKYKPTPVIRKLTWEIVRRILENSKKWVIKSKKYKTPEQNLNRSFWQKNNGLLNWQSKRYLDKFNKKPFINFQEIYKTVSKHSEQTNRILDAIIKLIPYDRHKL